MIIILDSSKVQMFDNFDFDSDFSRPMTFKKKKKLTLINRKNNSWTHMKITYTPRMKKSNWM